MPVTLLLCHGRISPPPHPNAPITLPTHPPIPLPRNRRRHTPLTPTSPPDVASLALSSSPTARREGKTGEEGGRSTTTRRQVMRRSQTRRRRAPLLRQIGSVGAATCSFSGRRRSSARAAPTPSERPRRRTQPRTGRQPWKVRGLGPSASFPWKAWGLMRFGRSPASLPDARRQLQHLQDGLLLLHGGVAAAPTLAPAGAMEGFDWAAHLPDARTCRFFPSWDPALSLF